MKLRDLRKRPLAGVILAIAWLALAIWLVPVLTQRTDSSSTSGAVARDAVVERLFAERESGRMVEIEAMVERILADDNQGSRHQRFIVALDSGRTLLVAHNIDLALRVPVQRGDRVEIRGQYEWNERGGVLHWTHHDPGGRRPGGWIRHRDRTYD